MADASISPLLVNPAPAPQAAPSPAQPKADEGAPKFYQVLKERSANSADKAAAKHGSKTAGSAESKAAAANQAQPDPAAQSTEGLPADSALALLLEMPGKLNGLGKDKPLTDETDAASVLQADTSALTPLADPAAAAAALAANAAKLAGNAGRAPQDGEGNAEQELSLTDEGGRGARREMLQADPAQAEVKAETDITALAGEHAAKPAQVDADKNFATTLANAQSQVAAAAAQAQAADTTSQTTATLPRHEVTTPVSSRNWAEDVSQKVSWVATKDNGRAELVLNPAHLGRIEVSINLNGEHATAAFVAANATAREALQDAMPRLREVLAQSGIQLGQTSVDAGTSGQAQADQQQASRSQSAFSRYTGSSLPDPVITSSSRSRVQSGNSMIDTFA